MQTARLPTEARCDEIADATGVKADATGVKAPTIRRLISIAERGEIVR